MNYMREILQPEDNPKVSQPFIAEDPSSDLQRKLTMLGFCFFRAAQEGEEKVMQSILTQAAALKENPESKFGISE